VAQVQSEVEEFLRLYEDYVAKRLRPEGLRRYRELRGRVARGEWVAGEKPKERRPTPEQVPAVTVKPSPPEA
jgi:hypothetical protein